MRTALHDLPEVFHLPEEEMIDMVKRSRLVKSGMEKHARLKYGIYWHRGMNSGFYSFDNAKTAEQVAKNLSRVKDVYNVQLLEYVKRTKVKGD